jgi:hypothetical protein
MQPILRKYQHVNFVAQLSLAPREWESTGELMPGQRLIANVKRPCSLRLMDDPSFIPEGDHIILTDCQLFVCNGEQQVEVNALGTSIIERPAPRYLSSLRSSLGLPEKIGSDILFRLSEIPSAESEKAQDGFRITRVVNKYQGDIRVVEIRYEESTGLPSRLDEFWRGLAAHDSPYKSVVFSGWNDSEISDLTFDCRSVVEELSANSRSAI